jgi:ribonucleoside-diphosphate reductase alpha chain
MTVIQIDPSRDNLLSEAGKATLADRYLMKGETYQGLFARVAEGFANDADHAQRLYDYMSKLWFMPSTPILSNGGNERGLPISCYLNEAGDNLESIGEVLQENIWLAAKGGGIGSYWGNLRSIGEEVKERGTTSGVIPFMKVQDSLTLAISQGSLRRGSSAIYLPIDHPEIEEFIGIRRPTGGDPNRRCLNLHHGICITDVFMEAVQHNEDFNLVSPKTGEIIHTVKARDLWIRILTARIETGEPYMLFIDTVNNTIPRHQKDLELKIKMSNLCTEITLPTGVDYLGKERTAVCCLSSLNLEKWDSWHYNLQFIPDIMDFLDNVLSDFIKKAPDSVSKARYSAERERSVGLGVMGFHSFLQSRKVPFESVIAKSWNQKIFSHIEKSCKEYNEELGRKRGNNLDYAENSDLCDPFMRFSNVTSIAPTASISIIANNSSPGIEPFNANVYTQKTLTGSFSIRNKNLEKVLIDYDQNTENVWNDIARNEGSAQHLAFLTDHEKNVFKTAQELDQRWIIEHAADRTPMIDQSQSVNLFIPANISKKELSELHFSAWRKGLKSLYYCRSTSMQRSEKVGNNSSFEECLSCQ